MTREVRSGGIKGKVRQIPAQPGGFEGFSTLPKALQADHLAAPEVQSVK
jgi:hypothetical protein